MIDQFRGGYAFLSNFYEAPVEYEGIIYCSNEAAFQAAKTLDINEKYEIADLSPAKAKKKGRRVKLRSDWEKVKYEIMYEICLAKFTQNEELGQMLLATRNEELIEGNTWGDTVWGICQGVGENNLGKILMRVRQELGQQHYIDNCLL